MKIVKDTNEEYHSQKDYISASGLKMIAKKSVHHYLNADFKSTPSMAFGTAVHTAIYEPSDFHKEYHIIPKIDRRTKAGKELYTQHIEEAKEKIILDEEDHQRILTILENLAKSEAKEYVQGEMELSHYTEFEGIKVRVRPDCVNKVAGFISDVKTCQDNSPRAFLSDIYKFKYHVQAAFYMDMLGVNKFVFIAIETNAPYSIENYVLSDELLEKGRKKYKKAIADWKYYLETDIALGYDGIRNDDGIIILG
jgi:exodeoxyribonuclease VIII